jgi:hypothetical protein
MPRTFAPPQPLPTTTTRTPELPPVSDAGAAIALRPDARDLARMHSWLGNQAMQRMILTRTQGVQPPLGGGVIPTFASRIPQTLVTDGQRDSSLLNEGSPDATSTDDGNDSDLLGDADARRSEDRRNTAALEEAEASSSEEQAPENVDPEIAARTGALRPSSADTPATDPERPALTETSIQIDPVETSVVQPQPRPVGDMAALQAQVLEAADNLPRPTLQEFTPVQAEIRRRGFQMAVARRGAATARARGPVRGGGVRIQTPPREVDPDPVPEATERLREKCNRRLPPVTPPALVATPGGNMPQIGRHALSADELHVLTELDPGEVPSGLDAEQQRAFQHESARLEELRSSLTNQQQPQDPEQIEAEAEPEPIFGIAPIEDYGAPRSVNYSEPREGRGDMGQVLARLLVDTEQTAIQIIRRVRDGIKIDGKPVGMTVSATYPTLGEAEHKNQLKTTLERRIRELAADAGIAEEVLNEKIATRRQELEEQRHIVAESVNEAVQDAAEGIRQEGERSAGAVAQVQRQAAEATERTREAAAQVELAMDIPSRRDRLITALNTLVTEQVTQYRQQGDIRKRQLDRAKQLQESAYRFAAQQDQYALTRELQDEGQMAVLLNLATEINRIVEWRDAQISRIGEIFEGFKTDTDTQVATFQAEVRTAGDEKREAIRAWADEQLGTQRTEEERLQQLAADQAAQREAEVRAWAAVENQRTVAAIDADFDIVRQIADDVDAQLSRAEIIERRSLSASQIAILDAYLTPSFPGESRESRMLNAVAAGAQNVLAREQQESLEPELAELVLNKPDTEWILLNRIAAAQGNDFNAMEVANKVFKAVDGLGTDEDAIFDALANLLPFQIKVLRAAYYHTHRRTIDSDLDDDLSGRELQRAQALMRGEQDFADAIGLRQATHGNYEGYWFDLGGISGIGVDREALQKIARGRDPSRRGALESAYEQLTGGEQLTEVVHSELHVERDRQRFDASLAGNFALADALELREILPTPAVLRMSQDPQYGGPPVVADRERVQVVYDRIRREVTQQAAREGGWSTARIESEILRRNREIEATFDQQFAEDYENPAGGVLRHAFSLGFQWRPEEANLANALADNDLSRADAALIEVENRGVYADDDIQNRILNAQYTRALEGLRRDEMPIRRMILERQLLEREQNDVEGRPWSPGRLWEERSRLQREVDRTLETAARSQGEGNLNALRDAYRNDYGGSLDDVVLSNTSGYGNMQASYLLAQGGYLTPAQQVYFAIRGSGTREEELKQAFEGRTAEEIQEMRSEFAEIARNDSSFQSMFSRAYAGFVGADFTDMDQEIMDDLSGRMAFDVGQLLKGTPETVEQQRQRLREALEYEMNVGSVGQALASSEMEALRASFDALDQSIARLNDRTISPERRDVYIAAFEQDIRTVEAGIQAHRASLDSMVDKITTAIGVAIGVAVGAIVSIFTFGAGGIVLAAVIGSILATAATIATKQMVLGQQYGWEDLATDLAIGVVDAVVAAATAGIGNKLLGIGRGGAQVAARQAQLMARSGIRGAGARFFIQGAGRFLNPAEGALARMIPTSARLSSIVERGGLGKVLATFLVEGGENLLQSSGSALMSTALNDQTWEQGNPFINLLSGTLKQAAMGTAMGMGMKPIVGGLSHAGGFVHSTWRNAADPAFHLLTQDWNTFRQQYPDISYRDFIEARLRAGLDIDGARVSGDEEVSIRDSDGVSDTSTTPSRATQKKLQAALPEQMRDQIPVIVDPSLKGRTVKVEYVRGLGGIGEIRIVAGPDARPIDVLLHTPTAQALVRYTGLTGRIVHLIERVQFWINRRGMPPLGSAAWEAHFELNKLPIIIEERIRALQAEGIDANTRAELLREIDHLSKQIDVHQATLDRMDVHPGSGYIAALGESAPVLSKRPLGERADPDAIRYRAEGSPLEKRQGKDSVFQIGPSWREDGRTYRVVEVIDADGRVVAVREEIRMMENGVEIDRWVQRGSEGNVTGRVGESASDLMTDADIAGGMNAIQLPQAFIQSASGAGFDGVFIRFNSRGVATIVIVEVKNYPGRYVPLADFTAIRDNLRTNLNNLRALLSDPTNAAALGLTPDQLKAAFNAFKARRFAMEIRLGPTTKLGDEVRGTVFDTISRELKNSLGSQVQVTRRTIDQSFVDQAQQKITEADRVGSTPHFYQLVGANPTKFTEANIRQAQLALAAERAPIGLVDPPLHRPPGGGTFKDRSGNHFATVDPPAPRGNPAAREKIIRSTAESLLDHLTNTASRPPGAKNSTKILVNVTQMTGPQRQELIRQLAIAAKKRGIPVSSLDRLVMVDVTRGTVEPVKVAVAATGSGETK